MHLVMLGVSDADKMVGSRFKTNVLMHLVVLGAF